MIPGDVGSTFSRHPRLVRGLAGALLADGLRRLSGVCRPPRIPRPGPVAPGRSGPDAPRPPARLAVGVGALEAGLGLAILDRTPLAAESLYRIVAPFYDQLAPLWRDWLYRDPLRALDAVIAAAVPRGGAVLDLGCGTGAMLERLVALERPFGTYVGVDFSSPMLDRAQAGFGHLPGVRFQRLDLRRDPLPAGPFDLIVSAWVLEHLPEPGQLVAEALTRLRPGGQLVLFFEIDGHSWRERLFRRPWRFFGARLVPESDCRHWPGLVTLRRFSGAGPAVALAVLTGAPADG